MNGNEGCRWKERDFKSDRYISTKRCLNMILSDLFDSFFFSKKKNLCKNAPILIDCSYTKRPIGAQFRIVAD